MLPSIDNSPLELYIRNLLHGTMFQLHAQEKRAELQDIPSDWDKYQVLSRNCKWIYKLQVGFRVKLLLHQLRFLGILKSIKVTNIVMK